MLRIAKSADPVLQQCACQGERRRVGHRSGFRPPRETADDGEEMCESLRRWQGPNNMNMNMDETTRWQAEIRDWCTDVAVHLGSLAWNASPRSGGDVCSDPGPDELCCEKTPSRADARMR